MKNQTEAHAVKGQEEDILSIQKVVLDAERFQNNAEQFAQLLTQDAAIVNVAGYRVMSRDEIYKIMKKAVETSLTQIMTRNEIVNISFLHSEVALVHCIKHISVKNEEKQEEDTKASLTFVMTKTENEQWLIALAQNTLMQNQAIENIKNQNIASAGDHMKNIKA